MLVIFWNNTALLAKADLISGWSGYADHRESTIACPHCGYSELLPMPTDYCFFYECRGCHEALKAKDGRCCVFCSYGDGPCPSVQESTDI